MTTLDATNRRSTVVSELMTVAEAAIEMRVSAHTVRRWIAAGQLEHVKLPSGTLRVPIEALSKMQRLPATPRPGHPRSGRRAA